MKVIIAGSRSITHYRDVEDAYFYSGFKPTEIVSGGARGADRLGEELARDGLGIPIKQFIPNWDDEGKIAGFIRNEQMAEYADALIAVWDGKSKGTKHMIECMTKLGKPVHVHEVKE